MQSPPKKRLVRFDIKIVINGGSEGGGPESCVLYVESIACGAIDPQVMLYH